MIRVLGLDLGKTWGWCRMTQPFDDARILCAFGEQSLPDVKMTSAGMVYSTFHRWLHQELHNTPDLVVYEAVRFNRGMSYIPGMTGVLLAELEQRSLPYVGLAVNTLKKHATGSGRATKAQVKQAVRDEWQARIQGSSRWDKRWRLTDNMADAIWCAHYGLQQLALAPEGV